MGRRSRTAKQRAGLAVQERIRKDRRAVLCAYAPRLLAFETLLLVVTVLVVSFQRGDFARGLFLGVMLMIGVAFVFYPWALNGLMSREMGAEAEKATTGVIRRLDSRRWFVIDDLFFAHANVDHVLVGPGRVFAVESKWCSYGVRPDLMLEKWVSQAGWGAGRVEKLLRSNGIRRQVTPVLLIWGPGHSIRGEHLVQRGDVLVATQRGVDALLDRLRQLAPGFELDHATSQALQEFAETQDAWLVSQGRQRG
jgi:hypothetical protein